MNPITGKQYQHLLQPPQLLAAIAPLSRLDREENSLYGSFAQERNTIREPQDLFQHNQRRLETYCEQESDLRSLDDWIRKNSSRQEDHSGKSKELTKDWTKEWTKFEDRSKEFIKVQEYSHNESFNSRINQQEIIHKQFTEKQFNGCYGSVQKPIQPVYESYQTLQMIAVGKETAKFTSSEIARPFLSETMPKTTTFYQQQPKKFFPTQSEAHPTVSKIPFSVEHTQYLSNFNWSNTDQNEPRMPVTNTYFIKKEFQPLKRRTEPPNKRRIFINQDAYSAQPKYRINPMHRRQTFPQKQEVHFTAGASSLPQPRNERHCIHVSTPMQPPPPINVSQLYGVVSQVVTPILQYQRHQIQIQTALSKLTHTQHLMDSEFYKLQSLPLSNLPEINQSLCQTRKYLLELGAQLLKSEKHLKFVHTNRFSRVVKITEQSLKLVAFVVTFWPTQSASQKQLEEILKNFRSCGVLEKIIKIEIAEKHLRKNHELRSKLDAKEVQGEFINVRCVGEFKQQTEQDVEQIKQCLDMPDMEIDGLKKKFQAGKQKYIEQLKDKLSKGQLTGRYLMQAQQYLQKIL